MDAWPEIPADVVDWFRGVFAEANRRICERLVNVPNIRETSLDDGLVEALIPESAPTQLPSGAIVRMDIHNVGGLRRFGGPPWDFPPRRRWETADIAILVFVYRGETLVAKKIGLLQSKRLYPANNDVEEDDEVGFLYGMNAFLRREASQAIGMLFRNFQFDGNSVYGAMNAGSEQIDAIDGLNRSFGEAVYYLFYNPHEMPFAVNYPLKERVRIDQVSVGCKVFEAGYVHGQLAVLERGVSPTYDQLQRGLDHGWPLEVWAADLLLRCRVGQAFDDSKDDQVRYFLERRSGPIGVALAASITLPE